MSVGCISAFHDAGVFTSIQRRGVESCQYSHLSASNDSRKSVCGGTNSGSHHRCLPAKREKWGHYCLACMYGVRVSCLVGKELWNMLGKYNHLNAQKYHPSSYDRFDQILLFSFSFSLVSHASSCRLRPMQGATTRGFFSIFFAQCSDNVHHGQEL